MLSSLFPILIKRSNQANPRTALLHASFTTYATTTPRSWSRAGVPVNVVGTHLGDADPSITLRAYPMRSAPLKPRQTTPSLK